MAKVEYGEGANKAKESITFSGSVTNDRVIVMINGRGLSCRRRLK